VVGLDEIKTIPERRESSSSIVYYFSGREGTFETKHAASYGNRTCWQGSGQSGHRHTSLHLKKFCIVGWKRQDWVGKMVHVAPRIPEYFLDFSQWIGCKCDVFSHHHEWSTL
jgi:hypothetical protein